MCIRAQQTIRARFLQRMTTSGFDYLDRMVSVLCGRQVLLRRAVSFELCSIATSRFAHPERNPPNIASCVITQVQEAECGSCTLHDDDPTGLIVVLRYILDSERVEEHGPFHSISAYMYGERHRWLNAAFITADKYDVPGLGRLLVQEVTRDLFSSNGKDLMQTHFHPMGEACGGTYPRNVYPSFAAALGYWNSCAAETSGTLFYPPVASQKKAEAARLANEIKAVAIKDVELMMYLPAMSTFD